MKRSLQHACLFALAFSTLALWTACGDSTDGSSSSTSTSSTATSFFGTSSNTSNTSSAPCTYPEHTNQIALGKVLPKMTWLGAVDERGERVDFSAESFFCDPAYDAYSVAVFIYGAGWCASCADYIEDIAGRADILREAGGFLVFVSVQESDGTPSTHAQSFAYIDSIVADTPSIRIGDGETAPTAGALWRADVTRGGFPIGFAVRRSDMVVIADQQTSPYYLPYVDIARDPDSIYDSFDPNRPPSCGPEDEEPSEPNDTPQQAALLPPGDAEGGVCGPDADFYTIDLEGRWLFEIRFKQSEGDLDFVLWDIDRDRPVLDANGNPLGSTSSDDNEVFQHQGPATIKVFGYNGATAAYDITLVDLQ